MVGKGGAEVWGVAWGVAEGFVIGGGGPTLLCV